MVEEAKDLFLATTGHELRTPLTVIRGFAGTLIDRWDALSDAERQEAVRIIGARADGLGVLIEQVLASSHAEAGARRLDRVPLDLGPIMTTAAVDIGSLSDKHDVTVVLPSELPRVLADEQALRTILGHLVDNAAKYSPAGGQVALSAAVNADGRSVAVRVDDEGIGVAHEDQERVFERFFQADGGDTRQRGGFGLGLYIVRRLVQAHEGTVTMSRRPDGRPGSRVELCLPVAPIL
jgi:signal transduction histidine kinase